ncbi:unnamed protein product [Lactuca virosa]|uniref:TIR domain-containing protein n=1 Tax=Lactuca virosa TaxID=75947 RepID=A0AAU9PGB6_9ASTR|nr:unnamed protein product [Lactuca virosa]
MLEQRRSFNHFVLPVFYHVDPSDIRDQRQSFAIEVEDGVEGSKWTEYNVNRWKVALSEVADLTGMVVLGSESDFIAKIVDAIDCKLDMKLVSTPAHLIGMDSRANDINSWLKNEQSGANMGRKIVLEESKDPAKRSRVLQNNESYRLLGKGQGSETIEGLAIDMRKLSQWTRSNLSKRSELICVISP